MTSEEFTKIVLELKQEIGELNKRINFLEHGNSEMSELLLSDKYVVKRLTKFPLWQISVIALNETLQDLIKKVEKNNEN